MPGTSEKGEAKTENGAVTRSAASGTRPRFRPSGTVPATARPAPVSAATGQRGHAAYAEGRRPAPGAFGVVVVDPLPLFRAGAVAALAGGGVPVLGEAAQLETGIQLVLRTRARVLLVGGATATEATEAVEALPGCSVVVLLSQPSREELVEMLGTGVAGFALSSLTPEQLVSTVETAASKSSPAAKSASPEPVFVPVLLGRGPVLPESEADSGLLTPKEREILAHLARGASNKRIAEALYVTPATVKTHLAHIYAKLGARGRHEAIAHAMAMGLMH